VPSGVRDDSERWVQVACGWRWATRFRITTNNANSPSPVSVSVVVPGSGVAATGVKLAQIPKQFSLPGVYVYQ
jgi:hypothetical protein